MSIRTAAPTAPLLCLAILAGCAQLQALRPAGTAPPPAALPPPPAGIAAVVSAPPPPAAARTAAQFDTTTQAQKDAASAPSSGEGRLLGETVASLGDPGQPGLWIRTALTDVPGSGRIEYAATGRSAVVQLIPSGGAAGSGSQVSLAALRLLEAPLTDLPTVTVYAD